MVVNKMFRVIFKYQKNFLEKKLNLILMYIFLEFSVLLTYYLTAETFNIIEYALNCIPLQVNFDILLFIQKVFCILFLLYFCLIGNDYILKINKAYLFFRVSRKDIVQKIYISNIVYILGLDLINFILALVITNFHFYNINISLIMSMFLMKVSLVNFSLLIKNNWLFGFFLLLIIILYMFYTPSVIFSLIFMLITYIIFKKGYIKTIS